MLKDKTKLYKKNFVEIGSVFLGYQIRNSDQLNVEFKLQLVRIRIWSPKSELILTKFDIQLNLIIQHLRAKFWSNLVQPLFSDKEWNQTPSDEL